jgi:hypothetical protein
MAVSIQSVTRAPGHCRIGERAAVDEKHVEPAVVVEVEEEATRPDDLRQVLLVTGSVDVDEIQPCLSGGVTKDRCGKCWRLCPLVRSCLNRTVGQKGDCDTYRCYRRPR